MMHTKSSTLAAGVLALAGLAGAAYAQPETMGWGNLTGIRVDGHLLALNSSLCVAQPGWAGVTHSGKEQQESTYHRQGETVNLTVRMQEPRQLRGPQGIGWAVNAAEVVEPAGVGGAKVSLEYTSPKASTMEGAYFCMALPGSFYSGGSVELINPASGAARVSLAPGANPKNEYVRTKASGARFISPLRQVEVIFDQPTGVVVQDDRAAGGDIQVYLDVMGANPAAGATARRVFTIKATGEIDKAPVQVSLDAAHPGLPFAGIGGNFRLQKPATDPQVIQYSLDNVRLAWGRVEMPWRNWQPNENSDPLADARAGKIDAKVADAMNMARRLHQKGMPVIVSAWFPPAWAIIPEPRQEGVNGSALNPAKMDKIKESIANYMLFMKEKYGVDACAFSFNESEKGIDVRQTAVEHDALIKTLGPAFASKGLMTKLLLGDNSNAATIDFIRVAQHDAEAMKYVAAVAFHSWSGYTDELLTKWKEAARDVNLPLLVTEASTDGAAWKYWEIFFEPAFALDEIELYMRMLSISQVNSILQWQFTADYSVLTGGGIWNDKGPLRPTQRYWNLKQLSTTPAGAFALPVKCDKPGVHCVAFGDIASDAYMVHVVNNGGVRKAELTGLPANAKQLRVWVTDVTRGMQEGPRVAVTDGKAELTLDTMSYTTAVTVQ
jgi:hypothetical protein